MRQRAVGAVFKGDELTIAFDSDELPQPLARLS